MTTLITTIIGSICFAILGPIVGCLLAGADRIISARMQGRVGPKLLQPYWDLRKLLGKARKSVNGVEGTYITTALVLAIVAGGIFFSGGSSSRWRSCSSSWLPTAPAAPIRKWARHARRCR